MSTVDGTRFRFGVEIEVITGSRENEHMEWYLTADELSDELAEIKVSNHVVQNHRKEDEDYTEWSLQQEVTIPNQMMQNKWGLELVSPILDFHTPEVWQAHIGRVWWVLANKFNTSTSNKCSTHVHISPQAGQWTLSEVRKVAKFAVYFERSVDSLLPYDRRVNHWCQSNRWNTVLKSQTMEMVFSRIDQAQSIEHVAFMVCAFSKDSDYGRTLGQAADFIHSPFRWNFSPLKFGGKGTIEFRQPPGSASDADTTLWVTFTAAFVQGALKWGDNLKATTPPSLDLFKSVLLGGLLACGVEDMSSLSNLFVGKTQLPAGAYDLQSLSPQELDQMRRKALEKNVTLEKFKKLFGYK
ncbi:putative amidoligase enzyme-domain-containing protein [Lophiotrema nucula]|uniref:Putative amidoligase enzyme-domain-containing protein n=1 Tax=Lophiotrema nucula TaxID=690887 RepID=A0A6A5YYG0_9PLEO|nr:putative amidoligase enzyme-domain-containing protein [Lophiotrema nucula]